MNKQEHLLACLAEEAGEIVQVVGKILRFGITEDKKEQLTQEIYDLFAVVQMLEVEDVVDYIHLNNPRITNKISKVNHYMHEAKEIGTLK